MQPRSPLSTKAFAISRFQEGAFASSQDELATEEPLEIRLFDTSISITMRTPGNDEELAAGFLFTEGIIGEPEHIESIRHCGPSGNVVRVTLRPGLEIDIERFKRHFYTSSSCGVCGKSSIEALKTQSPFEIQSNDGPRFTAATIQQMPETLKRSQVFFAVTGGLHAAALFLENGELRITREDVGRHNAVDKVIGHAFLNNHMPLNDYLLLVSGRASFELVQKASMAGIRMLAAVGAPSSLAVELAREVNLTLVGFLRDQRFNVYSGCFRVLS